jgi:hypothetical protein
MSALSLLLSLTLSLSLFLLTFLQVPNGVIRARAAALLFALAHANYALHGGLSFSLLFLPCLSLLSLSVACPIVLYRALSLAVSLFPGSLLLLCVFLSPTTYFPLFPGNLAVVKAQSAVAVSRLVGEERLKVTALSASVLCLF